MLLKKKYKYIIIACLLFLIVLAIVTTGKTSDEITQDYASSKYIETEDEGGEYQYKKKEQEESDYDKFLQQKVQEKLELGKDVVKDSYGEFSIDLGIGTIVLDEKNYATKLNELNRNVDKYIGREISYEGFIHEITNEQGETSYVVARYYEQEHNRIFHTTIMGLKGVYEGQWPALDTWVKVRGVVGKSIFNDQEIPSIIIEEMIVKSDEGQRRVYN